MQDRFKFRSWNIKKKKYYYDVQDFYNDECINSSDKQDASVGSIDEDYILEQCTGLKDKNGNLIYEGDIIETEQLGFTFRIKKRKYVVKFGEYNQDGSGGEYVASRCLGFYADNGQNEYDSTTSIQSLLDDSPIEIIGNIHEHKDVA